MAVIKHKFIVLNVKIPNLISNRILIITNMPQFAVVQIHVSHFRTNRHIMELIQTGNQSNTNVPDISKVIFYAAYFIDIDHVTAIVCSFNKT